MPSLKNPDFPQSIFECHLDSIKVLENGKKSEGKSALSVIAFTILWPRPRIVQRTSLKTLSLKDGETVRIKKTSFQDSILFKEIVQGPFGFLVELSEREKPSRLEEVLRTLGQEGILVGEKALNPLIPFSPLQSLSKGLAKEIGKKVKQPGGENLKIIGKGNITLGSIPTEKFKSAKIPLIIPSSVPILNVSKERNKPRRPVKTNLLQAGEKNGYIKIRYRIVKG